MIQVTHFSSLRFEFSGGEIAAVICTAAEAVAQHPTSPPSLITNTELFAAAEQELKKRQERTSSAFLSIFQ